MVLAVGLAGCASSDTADRQAREGPRKARDRPETKPAPSKEPARSELPARRRDVVVRVVDGDTIELRRLGVVRLIGVDTPEVYGGVECFGRAASAFTKRVLPTGARVRYDWGAERRDRYDRALVYLYRDRRFVNAELVRRGFAQPYTIVPNVEFADRFAALARRARRLGRGLWASRGCARAERRPRSCSDFATQARAQRYFRRNPRAAAGFDGDGDGRVCETLP